MSKILLDELYDTCGAKEGGKVKVSRAQRRECFSLIIDELAKRWHEDPSSVTTLLRERHGESVKPDSEPENPENN